PARDLPSFPTRRSSDLRPGYHPPVATTQAAVDVVSEAALALRQQHPRWGAPLIRSLLLRDRPAQDVPSTRALQRRFRKHGLTRRSEEHTSELQSPCNIV